MRIGRRCGGSRVGYRIAVFAVPWFAGSERFSPPVRDRFQDAGTVRASARPLGPPPGHRDRRPRSGPLRAVPQWSGPVPHGARAPFKYQQYLVHGSSIASRSHALVHRRCAINYRSDTLRGVWEYGSCCSFLFRQGFRLIRKNTNVITINECPVPFATVELP